MYRQEYYPNLPSRQAVAFGSNSGDTASEFSSYTYDSKGNIIDNIYIVLPNKKSKLYGFSSDSITYIENDEYYDLKHFDYIKLKNDKQEQEKIIELNSDNKYSDILDFILDVFENEIFDRTYIKNKDSVIKKYKFKIKDIFKQAENMLLEYSKKYKAKGLFSALLGIILNWEDSINRYFNNMEVVKFDELYGEILIDSDYYYMINEVWFINNFEYSYKEKKWQLKK